MSTIIFIDSEIPSYRSFAISVRVPIRNFSGAVDTTVNRVGFVWENNGKPMPFGINVRYINSDQSLPNFLRPRFMFFTREFIDFIGSFSHQLTVDLITCSLNNNTFKQEVNLLNQMFPNVKINYSVNRTGNAPYGDWIMESSGENIMGIYFNANITSYAHTLLNSGAILPLSSGYYADPANQVYLKTSTSGSFVDIGFDLTNRDQFQDKILGGTGGASLVKNLGFSIKIMGKTYTKFTTLASLLVFLPESYSRNNFNGDTQGDGILFGDFNVRNSKEIFFYNSLKDCVVINGYDVQNQNIIINVQFIIYPSGKIEYKTIKKDIAILTLLYYNTAALNADGYFATEDSGQVKFKYEVIDATGQPIFPTITINSEFFMITYMPDPSADNVGSGGDPIIYPLIGDKYTLAPHIKHVNLLTDYSKGIFVSAKVDMLKQSDFPEVIYWDNQFTQTSKMSHIYSNSYYRTFYIQYGEESVEIDADTLGVTWQSTQSAQSAKSTQPNKLKVSQFTPKVGLKSASFDKTYPLLNSTIGLKVGLGTYLLTITADINTDDRHYLELLNVKPYDLENLSGALISKDRISMVDDLVVGTMGKITKFKMEDLVAMGLLK